MRLLLLAVLVLASPLAVSAWTTPEDPPVDLIELLSDQGMGDLPICCCAIATSAQSYPMTGAAQTLMALEPNGDDWICYISGSGDARAFISVGTAWQDEDGTLYLNGQNAGSGMVFSPDDEGAWAWTAWDGEKQVGSGQAGKHYVLSGRCGLSH